MGTRNLDVAQTRQWLVQLSRTMIGEEERLTRADQAVGDGDHGIGMSRGFQAVCQELEQAEFQTLDRLFGAVGRAMLMSVGGAAGVRDCSLRSTQSVTLTRSPATP